MEDSDDTGLPYALMAVLYEGPLPQLLQQLLSDHSMQEIGNRDELYRALYKLLHAFGELAQSISQV